MLLHAHTLEISGDIVADYPGECFSPRKRLPVNQAPTELLLSATVTPEGSAIGSVVGTLSAVDPDAGETFTYTLLGNSNGPFSIDGNKLVVAGPLDYETAPSQEITVRVTDAAGNTHDRSFTIAVTNVAPSAPVDADDAANQILESVADGATVGIVAAAAEVDEGSVTYSLDDSAGGRFEIDAASGVVTVKNAALIDFESATQHTIVVRASDASGAASTTSFAIDVANDSSDTPPTGIAISNTMAAEGSAIGTVVGSLAAFDADADESFTFSLVDDAGGRFAVDGHKLVVAGQLDYEAATSHAVTICVTDSDGNSFDQDVSIGLVNIAPSTPVDSDSGANQILESATEGTAVGIIAMASEVDGGAVTYSLDGSADGRFDIDAASGVVTVKYASLIDYESANEHTIVVRASDASGAATTSTFTITVADDPSDTPPTGLSISNDLVAEGSSIGTVVGQIAAFDPDADDTFDFSFLDDAGGLFAIDGDRIVTAGKLDYEAASAHEVTIRVTDSDGNTYDQTVSISLVNVDPSTPVDSDSTANRISESVVNGAAVGIVALAQEVEGGAVIYSLDDSADGRFAIDPSSGAVTVQNAALIDFETAAQHTIVVRASDASGAFATASFVVDVVDDPNDTPIT